MQILRLVPTVPSRMVATVAAGIPYKLRDRDAQCTYLHGALQLAEQPAAVAVREGILAAAVNHLLGLDVEIRWQDIATAEAGIVLHAPCTHSASPGLCRSQDRRCVSCVLWDLSFILQSGLLTPESA